MSEQPIDELEQKEEVLSAVWAVVSPPWDNLDFKLTEARYWWNQHGYLATWTLAAMTYHAMRCYVELFETQEGYDTAILAPVPPDEVLTQLGSKSRGIDIARMTWDIVDAITTSERMGVNDPLIERQLHALDSNAKGSGVYMFGWWSQKAIEQAADQRDDPNLGNAAMAVYDRVREEIGLPPFEGDRDEE